MKRVDVACALIFDDLRENILMVRNKKGDSSYWGLPGGAVEVGETLEQAVKRETKEESGFEVEITGLHSVREVFFTEREHHAVIFTFQTTIIKGEIEISDPDNDILEVKWVELNAANKLMSYLPENLQICSDDNKLSPYSFDGTV